MLFLSTLFFGLAFVSGKVEINSQNRENFVLSTAGDDKVFAEFKGFFSFSEGRKFEIKNIFSELLKSGKATEKALIDWALINGCEIVGGGLHIKSEYGGIDCSAKISQLQQKVAKICSQKIGQNDKSSALILADKSALIQIGQCVLGQLRLDEKQIIQNALANGQNAKQKVALFKFGALIKAFLNELPEGQAKSALVKLLASKQQLLPSDLIDMLLNKLSFIAADRGRIGTEKSENPKKCSENVRKAKQFAQRRKRRGGFNYNSYIKMIFLLFIFGQVSAIAFLLLLFLLPVALQRPKPE